MSIYLRTSLKPEENLIINAFTNAFKNLSNGDNHFKKYECYEIIEYDFYSFYQKSKLTLSTE